MAGLAAPIGQKAAIAADFQCRWLTRPLHPEREFRVPPFAVWARPRQFTGFDGEQVQVRRFRVPSTACGFGAYSRSVDANLPLLGTAVSCDTLSGGLRSNLSVPGRGREGLESALSRRYCGPQRMRRIAPKPTLPVAWKSGGIPDLRRSELARKARDQAPRVFDLVGGFTGWGGSITPATRACRSRSLSLALPSAQRMAACSPLSGVKPCGHHIRRSWLRSWRDRGAPRSPPHLGARVPNHYRMVPRSAQICAHEPSVIVSRVGAANNDAQRPISLRPGRWGTSQRSPRPA